MRFRFAALTLAGPIRAAWTLAGLALAGLTLAALAGCGVGVQHSAQEIDVPRGPFEALASPTPVVTESGSISEHLYLVKDGLLVRVTRKVDGEPTVDSLIDDLLAGPTSDEREAGISSSLVAGTIVSGVRVDGTNAVVELSTAWEGAGRNDEVLGFGQLVCTLTARADISGVVFQQDQQVVAVPRADLSLSQGPLSAADYTSLIG